MKKRNFSKRSRRSGRKKGFLGRSKKRRYRTYKVSRGGIRL